MNGSKHSSGYSYQSIHRGKVIFDNFSIESGSSLIPDQAATYISSPQYGKLPKEKIGIQSNDTQHAIINWIKPGHISFKRCGAPQSLEQVASPSVMTYR